MASFTLTPVEKGILRCRHTDPFTPQDIQALAGFLREYSGKLLIDLTGACVEECSRHLRQFRPMLPTSAIFGAPLDPAVLEIDKSYYANDVRLFPTEEAALTWLRNQ